MNLDIKVTRTKQSRLGKVNFKNIPFGKTFSDHMFIADYKNGKWGNLQIRPFGRLPMHPANVAIHYGQSIFEGMKASKTHENEVILLRPEMHTQRLNASARRMCMAEIPHELFMRGLEMLLDIDRDWVPTHAGSSLYIRPVLFATDETVGVHASHNYRLIIMTGPVGPYYPKPLNLLAESHYIRAAHGGVGEAKTAGNYAASLLPTHLANQKGFDQIMWLDANEHKYVQEAGTMNLFFVINGVVVTPQTDGAILKGITRDTFLHILKAKNIPYETRTVSIDEIKAAHAAGTLQECFGAGTAAVVSQIASFTHLDQTYTLPSVENRPIATMLKAELEGLRNGSVRDTFGWVHEIKHSIAPAIAEKKRERILALA